MRYILLLFLFTILIGGIVYWLAKPYFSHSEGGKRLDVLINTLRGKSEELYEKPFSLYHTDIIKAPTYYSKSTIYYNKESGGNAYISLSQSLGRWEVYTQGNIVCYTLFRVRKCAKADNSSLMNIAETLKDALPSKRWVEKRFIRRYILLNETSKRSVYEFKHSKEEVEGTPCDMYTIKYSYKDLTPKELAKVGVSVDSATALADVEERICIDERGLIVYSNISYNNDTNDVAFIAYNLSSPSRIEVPTNLSSASDVENLAYEAIDLSKKINSCEDDACIRTAAIENRIPDLCAYTSNLTLCIDGYLAFHPEEWEDVKDFLESSGREDLVEYFSSLLNKTANATNSSLNGSG